MELCFIFVVVQFSIFTENIDYSREINISAPKK